MNSELIELVTVHTMSRSHLKDTQLWFGRDKRMINLMLLKQTKDGRSVKYTIIGTRWVSHRSWVRNGRVSNKTKTFSTFRGCNYIIVIIRYGE